MRDGVYVSVIVLASIIFGFHNISTIPFWHWDEGVNANIAWNLAQGRLQMFAITYNFMPHPPFGFLVFAFAIRAFGYSVLTLRMFSAFLGIIIALFVYLIGRRLGSRELGFLAGLSYAVIPTMVYWRRMGFTYNILGLLLVLLVYCILTGRLRLAAAFAGLCAVTDMTGGIILAFFMFFLVRRGLLSKRLVAISVAPLIVYSVAMVYAFREEFFIDFFYLFERFNLSVPKILVVCALSLLVFKFRAGVISAVSRYVRMVSSIIAKDFEFTFAENAGFVMKSAPYLMLLLLNAYWGREVFGAMDDDFFLNGIGYHWVGIFGLLMLRERWIFYYLFSPLLAFLLLINRADHMLIPLHPLLAVGFGCLILQVYQKAVVFSGGRVLPRAVFFVLAFYPLTFFLVQDYSLFFLGKGLDVESIDDIVGVSEFVNNYSSAEDFVIGESCLDPYVDARLATLLQSASYGGRGLAYYRDDIDNSRFLFNVSIENARLIVSRGNLSGWLVNSSREDVADYLNGLHLVYNNSEFMVLSQTMTPL
ncbi:MAG: glycosyltransferase family 39 protein [Candidatus Altiarchaeota archaeon]